MNYQLQLLKMRWKYRAGDTVCRGHEKGEAILFSATTESTWKVSEITNRNFVYGLEREGYKLNVLSLTVVRRRLSKSSLSAKGAVFRVVGVSGIRTRVVCVYELQRDLWPPIRLAINPFAYLSSHRRVFYRRKIPFFERLTDRGHLLNSKKIVQRPCPPTVLRTIEPAPPRRFLYETGRLLIHKQSRR